MPPAVAIAGAAVVGAGASIYAGSKAAKAQKQAADMSVTEQRRQYDIGRQDMEPWRVAGQGALAELQRLYGLTPSENPYVGFTASPGYQFRMDQGIQAIERSSAARGLRNSGAAAKAIQRYGEGLAASEYDAFAARLANMAGIGQQTATTGAALGASAATNIGQALIASGNARASSYANTGSAINTGLNNLLTAYLYQQGGGFGRGGAGGNI